MTSRDFAYWLQGFFEISKTTEVTSEQVEIIRNHLNMVFVHEIDPSHGDKAHQKKLAETHRGLEDIARRITDAGETKFNC